MNTKKTAALAAQREGQKQLCNLFWRNSWSFSKGREKANLTLGIEEEPPKLTPKEFKLTAQK